MVERSESEKIKQMRQIVSKMSKPRLLELLRAVLGEMALRDNKGLLKIYELAARGDLSDGS